MKKIISLLLLFSMTSIHAQKKVILIDSSKLTGIALPAGSKQDKRGLSVMSANILMEMISKNAGTPIKNTEVFYLPNNSNGFTADSLSAAIEFAGWKTKMIEGEKEYQWLEKSDRYVLAYFSPSKKEINLYFSEAEKAPSFKAAVKEQQTTSKKEAEIKSESNTKSSSKELNSNTGLKLIEGYTFTTSNFDDGWTATEEADWVRVTKGSITVLLHYAKEGTTTAADPEPHVSNAWNILVAPRYSSLKNYKVASPSLDHQRAYLGAGDLTDNKTGKQVYVALFRKGSSNWMEIIAPDKNSFVNAFGADINYIGWDASSDIWNPLLKMFNYNKFAVAASDLTGKWASWSGSNVQYVNVYTGLDAGMGHAQSGNEIVFNANGTYNREYKGVSGSPGGGNQYYGEKNNGKAIVSNWEVQLTNSFKGETHVFTAQFEAVKGGRILHLYRGNIEEMYLYKIK